MAPNNPVQREFSFIERAPTKPNVQKLTRGGTENYYYYGQEFIQ
jgi:hypothetical protein